MNEWKEIIKNSIDCIVPISLSYKGEQISYGSGTICNENGKVITACHVIDQLKDLEDDLENVELLVRLKHGVVHYKPLLTGITMDIPDLANDILIDVAIIEPIEPIKIDYFLTPNLEPKPIEYGESLLLAGYSEETPFVFNFDKILGRKIPKEGQNAYQIQLGFMKPPTFKSGILSHKANLHLNGNMKIISEIIHIDNGMHSGASGGPIINSDGEFIGIITHRAMISIKIMVEQNLMNMLAPSGNTYGIGTSALNCYADLL